MVVVTVSQDVDHFGITLMLPAGMLSMYFGVYVFIGPRINGFQIDMHKEKFEVIDNVYLC